MLVSVRADRLALTDPERSYDPQWKLIAGTVAARLVRIVTFGSTVGSCPPFVAKRSGFDPAAASAPLVATLVGDVGIEIYFSLADLTLPGTFLSPRDQQGKTVTMATSIDQ